LGAFFERNAAIGSRPDFALGEWSGEIDFVELDPSWIEPVFLLERLSYPTPWTRTLLERELVPKSFSLNAGLLVDNRLVGQSFNYFIADELHILNLAIHPKCRGAGFGKRLLAHVLARAVKNGADYATLEVRPSNSAAKALYTPFGFSLAATRKRYYKDNGEDAMVYERRFHRGERRALEAIART